MLEQGQIQWDDLENDTVKIVIFKQSAPPIAYPALYEVLSQDEVQRMQAYYTDRLKQAYAARRGMLRHILAAALGATAKSIKFACTPYGKPYLIDDNQVAFNLSHSKDLAMIGICRSPIGLDIEAMVASHDLEAISKSHFAPEEQQTLATLTSAQYVQGFYHAWTRKEAFIKMDGRGLQIPLDSFAVTIQPNIPPRILRSDDGDTSNWQLVDLPVPDGFVGALVVGTQVTRVQIISRV